MKVNKFSILFYAKNSKATPSGVVPIYMRVTLNGVRLEISTTKNVQKSSWSAKNGKLKGQSEEARSINSYLDTLRYKAYEIENCMIRNQIPLEPSYFKMKFHGVTENKNMLIVIFKEHNRRMELQVGREFAINTLKKYRTTLSHLIAFVKWKFRLNDIAVGKVNLAFINDFDFYLRTEKNCNNNSTIKYIRNFGKIIKECYANELIEKDPFIRYKGKIQEVEIEVLNTEELSAVYSKIFQIPRLELVRDIYIFSCYTGLAYADIEQLSDNNISIGIDGTKWIFKSRQKTNVASSIPLLPIAEEILLKYQDHPKCLNSDKLLPILSNQKMNSYLKEIADVCGVNKNLTFHTARHTFATTVALLNGVSLESSSSMLGHSSIRTTQHYAKVVNTKLSKEMNELRAQLKSNKIQNQSNSSTRSI